MRVDRRIHAPKDPTREFVVDMQSGVPMDLMTGRQSNKVVAVETRGDRTKVTFDDGGFFADGKLGEIARRKAEELIEESKGK